MESIQNWRHFSSLWNQPSEKYSLEETKFKRKKIQIHRRINKNLKAQNKYKFQELEWIIDSAIKYWQVGSNRAPLVPNCGQNPIDHGALDHDDNDADKYVDEHYFCFQRQWWCSSCFVDSCSARPCNFCQKLSLVSRVRWQPNISSLANASMKFFRSKFVC